MSGPAAQNVWGTFMQECSQLAERHPYVIKPSGKQVGSWAICFSIGESGDEALAYNRNLTSEAMADAETPRQNHGHSHIQVLGVTQA